MTKPFDLELLQRFKTLGLDKDMAADMSDEEKIEMARAMLLVDAEFANEVFERGGPSLAEHLTQENIDKVRYIQDEKPEWLAERLGYKPDHFNMAGEYVASEERAAERNESLEEAEISYGGHSYKPAGTATDRPVEKGSILLYGTPGIEVEGGTAAHEFMHLRNFEEDRADKGTGFAHIDIYAEMAARARNEDELDQIVEGFMVFMRVPEEKQMDPSIRRKNKELLLEYGNKYFNPNDADSS